MPEYNLSGLSTRSFEQLVQSLAASVLGPGLVIFGDGPDGGREATFEGRVPYPSESVGWQGYIVVQAKFRQRPEGSLKDGKWILAELEGELKKFASRKRGLRTPEYYLLCTNVVLSPTHKTGSKDRAADIFARYRKRLPIKGFDVWDYDKLRVFLDQNTNVRRAYSAWITPGDVLATVISYIERVQPNFQADISTFLQKELLADQYVNLDQAGHSADEQVPMARVFVDLLASSQQVSEAPTEEVADGDPLPPGFIREVLEAGERRLGGDVFDVKDGKSSSAGRSGQPDYGRIVLIGGPGQGKSTTAQYLCQLYRVALLAERPRSLSAECRRALTLIEKHCRTEGIEIPRARRFPIRVILSDFARELASSRPDAPRSLLAYLVQRVRTRTGSELVGADLKKWLANYPWFLVLDGLDEVPASANRSEVLAAIQEFWVDAAAAGADLLVLATTRPQGYSKDFSPEFYTHRYLAPLSVPRAMHYARRFTAARFGYDTERGRRVIERLSNASTVEATARLMTSPLQVTIMATLVDRAGQPPPERWRLFFEYYDVIYKREVERETPASAILRAHKGNIDAIHQWVGLELQVEGERTGSTDARLSRGRFAAIVKSRLSSEGYVGTELEGLCNSITEAATQRLVFLVGAESDRVGFEIRSLQEFMAAEALMDGTDPDVDDRLKSIGPITYWRNVFLFAAGKCFAARPHLRDIVASVCDNLNEEGDVERYALAGSEVALDLLRDGSVRQHPKYQNRLGRSALRLCGRPAGPIHRLLADAYHEALDQVFREELFQRMGVFSKGVVDGTLCTVVWLSSKGVSWAVELAERNWPKIPDAQFELLRQFYPGGLNAWLDEKATRLAGQVIDLRHLNLLARFTSAPWARTVRMWQERAFDPSDQIPLEVSGVPQPLFSFGVSPCRQHYLSELVSELPKAPRVLRSAAKFSEDPSKKNLALFLRESAEEKDLKSVLHRYWQLPWPLWACLQLANSRDDASTLAKRADSGELGDSDDWQAAEERWRGGITTLKT